MIEVLTEKYEDTVAIKMSGKLTAADYDKVVPLLESKIKTFSKINLYCELGNIESIEPEALWKDLKFDVKHFNHFERVAIVGDKKWMEWMSRFSEPFTSADVEYFDSTEKTKAMEWVVFDRKEAHETRH